LPPASFRPTPADGDSGGRDQRGLDHRTAPAVGRRGGPGEAVPSWWHHSAWSCASWARSH